MAPIRKHHRRGWFEQPVHFRCSLKATSPIHHHFLLPLPFFNSLLPWRDRNTFRARKQITIYGRQHVMLRLVAPTAVQRRVVAWCRRQRMRRCGTTWLESRLCRHQLQDYIDRTDCPVEAAATLRRRFGAPTTALPECTVPISDLWPQSARRPIPSWIPCSIIPSDVYVPRARPQTYCLNSTIARAVFFAPVFLQCTDSPEFSGEPLLTVFVRGQD